MQATARLTGAELLAKIKEMKGASKSTLAKECGYVKTLSNGDERCQFTAFYKAIAEANGINLAKSGPSVSGRPLSYSAKVLSTGAILIGARYVDALGLKAGDYVDISTSARRIVLTGASTDIES